MTNNKKQMISVNAYAAAYGVEGQSVRELIWKGYFKSAKKVERGSRSYWIIDPNEPFPKDNRTNSKFDNRFMNKVVSTYRKLGSINATAKAHNIYPLVARRILITKGEYATDFTRQVKTLADQGLSNVEIAEKLDVKRQTVNNALPFKKGEREPQ